MSTFQEKFEKNKSAVIRNLVAIGVVSTLFSSIVIFDLNALTLISIVGLTGTLAGVAYSHIGKGNPKGLHILRDEHFATLYEDLYRFVNAFFQYLRTAALLVNPTFTAAFIISVYLAWKFANGLGDFYTLWLAGVGYPISRIADALAHDEIQALKAKLKAQITEQIKGLSQKIPKAQGTNVKEESNSS